VRLRRLRGLKVTLGGQRLHVHRRGRRRTVTVDLGPTGAQPVVLVETGRTARGHRVTVRRTYRGC